MKHLKTFESFVLMQQDFKLDKNTVDFIENKITENQFIEYLNTEFLNEGIISSIKEFISRFKEKVYDILMSFLKKAFEIGFYIFEKLKTFINWILNYLSKWKKENPVLFKVVIITLLVIILLMVSTSTLYAHTTGTPININHINVAIGYLEQIKSMGIEDSFQLTKAMAHLIDLRDGTIDIPLDQLGDESIASANAAMEITNNLIKNVNVTKDRELIQKCFDLMKAGSEYTAVEFSKVGGSEKIKLVVK